MRLTTISGGKRRKLDAPTDAQVVQAVIDSYADKNKVVILDDTEFGVFIQTSGSCHFEYIVEAEGSAYMVDGLNEDQAQDLFLSFACGDGFWKEAVAWKFDVATSTLLRRTEDYWKREQQERQWAREQEQYYRQQFEEFKTTVMEGQRRFLEDPDKLLLDRLTGQFRLEPARQYDQWSELLRPIVGNEADIVIQEAMRLEDNIEVHRFEQWLDWLHDMPLHNVTSVRKVKSMMVYPVFDHFLTRAVVPVDNLRLRRRQLIETLARFRSIKKAQEADRAKSVQMARRLRQEARDLLREDWADFFPGEGPPSF